jgi:protein-ribulosamine 3-kinase
MQALEQLKRQLETPLRQNLTAAQFIAVGGGDINRAYRLKTPAQSWFIKLNRPALLPMFEAEAAGLRELAQLDCVQVPQVVASGAAADEAYLVLEYLELKPLSTRGERRFAEQLAQQHQRRQAYFGWFRDNTIGSTPQENGRYADWVSFWQQQRLGKQLALAAKNGYGGMLQRDGEKLLAHLGAFFTNYTVQSALLHGDLWRGNVAETQQNQPVMFDPACYYGDREADMAMTELFGGFSQDFYAVYHEHAPLDAGYRVRKTLYNLYHILNHLNLFGGGYLRQAEAMTSQLLAQLHR